MVAPDVLAALFERINDMPLPVAASELARAGVPVFPCVPGEKGPIVRRGFQRATSDLRRVQGWWWWRPSANIGIPTGAVSGLVVIDVDVHGVNGYAAYARAARAGLIPEPLVTVTTPTGGQHSYFPAQPGREQRSWVVAGAGVDCRGDGGYIIAPPSVLRLDGGPVPYRVERVAASAVEPVDAVRLRSILDPPRPPRQNPPARQENPAPGDAQQVDAERLAAWLARRGPGDRNNTLFRIVCRLAERKLPLSDALDAFTQASQPDFGEREITRTVLSAYDRVSAGGRGRPSPGGSTPIGDFARRDPPPRAPASRGLA